MKRFFFLNKLLRSFSEEHGVFDLNLLKENAAPDLAEVFMCHEGLLLDYESSLTRKVSTHEEVYYNLGSHFLWIGDRTRQIDGGHVEYFRGIKNPIGIKVGPSMCPTELSRLLDILDPDYEIGKVTIITRYGADKVKEFLPYHINAVKHSGHKVIWCCDPMHGNTEIIDGDLKTRRFERILAELFSSFKIHLENESRLQGCHLELTGEPVTEVIGGSENMEEADLIRNYQSSCDPRLNYEQSLHLAFMIAKEYKEGFLKQ